MVEDRKWPLLLLLGALWSLSGCIDPIEVSTGPPENRLVVEGLVTEGDGPHRVKLTRSAAFRRGIDALRPAERNAQVSIITGDGLEVQLLEISGGIYETEIGQLIGQPGETYSLRIRLSDGTTFASEPAEMRPAPPVVSTYGIFERGTSVVGNILVDSPRISLRVDAASDPAQPTFYRWTWRGVFAADVCLGLACQSCYLETAGASKVEVASNALVAGPVLPDQPVHNFMLPEDVLVVLKGLYVEVEQQSLTPEAYGFWSLIRTTRDQVGNLFDPPPDAAVGNVRNVENPSDFALGYFTVAGTSHASTCIRLTDYPERPPIQTEGFISGVCGQSVRGTTSMPQAYRDACEPE